MTQPTRSRASPVPIVCFFFLVTVLTVAGFLTFDGRSPPASKHGAGVDAVIEYLLLTTGAIFVAGHVILGYLVWRFSRAEQATYKPVSRRSEWALALVPVLVMAVVAEVGVLVMGLPVWGEIYGEVPRDALQVEVVGKQFEWLVRYPGKDGKLGRILPERISENANPVGLDDKDPAAKDDIIVRGVLHVPLGRAVSVSLRSHDVLHSFAIPAFRLKQDLIPGFTAQTQFLPVIAGEFEIACAELCGLGHYRMRGVVRVEAPEEYERWMGAQQGWFE